MPRRTDLPDLQAPQTALETLPQPSPLPRLTLPPNQALAPVSLGPPQPLQQASANDPAPAPTPKPQVAPRADMDIPLGEVFQLHPNVAGFGPVKQAFVNRPEVIEILPLAQGAPSVHVVGKQLGLAQVTLVNQAGQVRVYAIRITANPAYLQLLVRQRFPQARIRIGTAGENAIFVDGSVDAATEVEPILALLRGFLPTNGRVINGIQVTGVTQVQLEVCIARVDRTRSRQLGFNFLNATRHSFIGNQVGNVMGVPSIMAGGGGATGAAGVVNNFNATGGATADVLQPASTLFFGVTSTSDSFFGFIEALEKKGLAKILARPTLVTFSGRPADFLVGGEIPYPSFELIGINGVATPAVEFKPFGTRLTFLPIVLGNGMIRLDVLPEIVQVTRETVNINGVDVPVFNAQRLRATVEMESGQSLALGGLLQTEEEADISKVPILGDLPVLGPLFRQVEHNTNEFELLILVTPRLFDPLQANQRPAYIPGQETRSPSNCELYWKGLPEVPAQPLRELRSGNLDGKSCRPIGTTGQILPDATPGVPVMTSPAPADESNVISMPRLPTAGFPPSLAPVAPSAH